MKRYWGVVTVVFVCFLAFFLLAEHLNFDPSTNFDEVTRGNKAAVALMGIGLLTSDVLLPIPSSLIMISNGVLFGIWLGSLISTIGALCASVVGFWIGQRGGPLLERLVTRGEYERAHQLLAKWGWLAILVTRPLPLLAETTVIMAGASKMKWKTMLVASIAGSLPVSVLYAITGATAHGLDNQAISFGLVLLMAGFFWMVGHRVRTIRTDTQKGKTI